MKLEPPGLGDMMRHIGVTRAGTSAIFHTINRNKQSLAVNLQKPGGRDTILKMVPQCDVFVQNLHPGAVEKLGLDADSLLKINPELIYVSISGFGGKGPYADYPAYDIVIQALSGVAVLQAGPERDDPELVNTIFCDKITAVHAAQAICAALYAREKGRGGQHIELSLFDATISFIWPDGMDQLTYLGDGASKPSSYWALIGINKTRDGYMTMLPLKDPEFQGLCRALGHTAIAEDARFSEIRSRADNALELRDLLKPLLALQPSESFLERLRAEKVPCARVVSPDELPDDPQVRAIELLQELTTTNSGKLRTTRPVSQFGGTPAQLRSAGPGLGEHTQQILEAMGVSTEDIKTLRAEGAIA